MRFIGPYDEYEVRPIRAMEDGHPYEIEECEPNKATNWGLYKQTLSGLYLWIADFPTRADAVAAANIRLTAQEKEGK